MREITVAGVPYTLLPFVPDWSTPPRFVTTWDTEIEQSTRGYETRGQLRSAPRPTLSFAVSFSTPAGYGELCAALSHGFRVNHAIAHEEGANAGTAQFVAPWAGRESWLQSWTTDTLTVDPTPWPWAVDDWLTVFDDAGRWVAAKVTAVAANVLTIGSLSAALSTLALADGCAVMPLFFGRLEAPDVEADSPIHSKVELTLVGSRYEVPANVPPACAGEVSWPVPPLSVGPTAVASATVVGMVASFVGSASTAGTSPVDGVLPQPIIGYEWQFGDGIEGVGADVEHEYLASGTFTAVLTVRDGVRRYDAAVVTVTIEEPGDDGSSGEVGGGTP